MQRLPAPVPVLVLVLFLLLVQGCATKKQVAAKPLDVGVKAVFNAPFDKVKRAVYDALGETTYTVKEEKWDGRGENAYVVLASQGLSAGSTGRYARVVIDKTETQQTVHVHVESKAATKDAVVADEAMEKDLLGRIEKRVSP